MILFPNAKINIGLNIVSRRDDGFHDIETIFYPIKGLCDILEIILNPESEEPIIFSQSGLIIDGPTENNLCIKAYHILKEYTNLPPVIIHLHKQIPFGAGLGGGSSDGAFTLAAINKLAKKPLPYSKLKEIALLLGSDCPFFILNKPCYATGRGEILTPIKINLSDYFILLVNPNIHVNTGKAYSLSKPKPAEVRLPNMITQDVHNWNGFLVNDFEKVVFDLHPEIGIIKNKMYELGAEYAAMSGSGSTVFGLFKNLPSYHGIFDKYYTFCQKL